MSIAWPVFGYLVLIGGVIVIHELGHLMAAMCFRVDVDRFSVGIGRPVYRRPARGFSEFAIGAFPIGGYVRFSTGSPRQGRILYAEAPGWQRLLVVLAGPAINLVIGALILAATAFGSTDQQLPLIYDVVPGSAIELAGAQRGDQIVTLAGEQVRDLRHTSLPLIRAALMGQTARWGLLREGRRFEIVPSVADPLDLRVNPLEAAGLSVFDLQAPPRIRAIIEPNTGLLAQAGDLVVEVNGRATSTVVDLRRSLRGRAGVATAVTVRSGSGLKTSEVTPARRGNTNDGVLGVQLDLPLLIQTRENGLSQGAVGAITSGVARATDFALISAASLVRLLRGDIGIEALSGPVQIAQASGDAVRGVVRQAAWERLFVFFAVLSIAIGVINLAPIPVFDGGQAVLVAIEMLCRRPIPARVMSVIQHLGVMVIGVMLLAAAYSDYLSLTTP